MRAPSLRTSLLAWFGGTACFLLIVFSVALYTGVRRSLLAGVDAELRVRADSVLACCEVEDGELRVEVPEVDVVPWLGDATHVEVWAAADRRLLASWGAPVGGPMPDVAAGFALATLARGPAGARAGVLVADVPAATGAQRVVIRVARGLDAVAAQLDGIALLAVVLTAVAVALVFGFGAFAARRIVRPLQRLAAAAGAAPAGGTGPPPPMPCRGTGDEIDRLAAALDDAFRSLHGAMERQRRFTADASHELRNPIAALQSTAEVALRRDRPGAEYREALATVRGIGARMARMVDALLLLARLDVRTREAGFDAVDLGDVAAAAVAGMAAAAAGGEAAAPGAGAAVRLRQQGDCTVRGHRELLQILVDNLLRNARQHAPAGTAIDLELARRNVTVHLTVADAGPGIPERERARVFDRFFRGAATTDRAGAGLGLAIVGAIAEAHGGTVHLDPAPAGTRIALALPAPP